ncbi:hypothetical protein TELCIR_09242 [Teladorsagia circumcincta]|uniref:Cytochrome c oxidase subunit Vb n=1 Tax=Teladorsagia circumcincta TaxID=45464 RepID=A0A2G9UFF2_TELCI|nr:hypothetical protein TELCIR_09242 [Teladorsagia circumcincta]
MAQLTARTVLSALSKRTLMPAVVSHRSLASEASPEDYGYYPDPLEHATGREKKMLLARLAGDDVSEPDSGHVNFMIIRKGVPKRCECGHWFKAIDADPESV